MEHETSYTRLAMLGTASALDYMESAILSTPTSERRNLMTEANILLLSAQEKLREIEKLESIS